MTNYKVFPHNNAYRIYYRAGETAPWQDLMELDPHAPICATILLSKRLNLQ